MDILDREDDFHPEGPKISIFHENPILLGFSVDRELLSNTGLSVSLSNCLRPVVFIDAI